MSIAIMVGSGPTLSNVATINFLVMESWWPLPISFPHHISVKHVINRVQGSGILLEI